MIELQHLIEPRHSIAMFGIVFVQFKINATQGYACATPGDIKNGNWTCQKDEISLPEDFDFKDSNANIHQGKKRSPLKLPFRSDQ